MKNSLRIDEQILTSDKIICRQLDNLRELSTGQISQDILPHLRNFVEHIMLKIYAKGADIEDTQENTKKAVIYAKNESSLRHLSRFHHCLQIAIPHRALEEDNSERLMLKYYEYLLKIKNFLSDKYSLDVLHNLEHFPIETDESMRVFYKKISEKINEYSTPIRKGYRYDRFYIHNIKPFFFGNRIYYEVAFVPANDMVSKTDRIIAFTNIEITDFYAVKFAIANDYIDLYDKKMPIRIIVDWEVSIRPCEYKYFSKIFDYKGFIPGDAEQLNITKYLTRTGTNLSEIIMFSDKTYKKVRDQIVPKTDTRHFFDTLDICRSFIKQDKPGCNILRYLLYHMTNRIIKGQCEYIWIWNYEEQQKEYIGKNAYLSNLYLSYKCIPFETMPFCSCLKHHIPRLPDLFNSLDASGHESEILARMVKNNTEQKGILFTPLEKCENSDKYNLEGFNDTETLINTYNGKLYSSEIHQSRKLIIQNNYIFIQNYKDDTIAIIQKIKGLANKGVDNYSNTVKHWLINSEDKHVAPEKKTALINMFDKSHVSLIYGSAGTGKTYLINYISLFFNNYSRLYLAQTNSAVNNLKRNVNASFNSKFMTISKFNNRFAREINREYDILFIDECSTVSNHDMKELLNLAQFKLLVLVGDTYQIEAIEFGNWFDAVRSFLPKSSICELTETYRSDSKLLLGLWKNVRLMSDDVLERLQAGEFSSDLDASIFNPVEPNEIILCLNYGGLYGINNVNYFMQENNKGKMISRGIQQYKVGDPILFNDSAEQFFSQNKKQVPKIYNNMKGRIVDFRLLDAEKGNECIQFDIELDEPLMELDTSGFNFRIINNVKSGNSIIRFEVYKNKSTDEDEPYDGTIRTIVPFQVAYAVSIHKAQGLEYDSVKIVITDEIDELITHSIFYTAITRARKKLKIYWTKAVEQKVLDRIKPKDNHRDVSLLKNEIVG